MGKYKNVSGWFGPFSPSPDQTFANQPPQSPTHNIIIIIIIINILTHKRPGPPIAPAGHFSLLTIPSLRGRYWRRPRYFTIFLLFKKAHRRRLGISLFFL